MDRLTGVMAKEKRWHHAGTDAVQQRILDAALTAFQHRGYSDTTMADIVAGSGASTGSVYHHFGGKEELFTACFSRLRDTIRNSIGPTINEDAPEGWESDFLWAVWCYRNTCNIFLGADTPPGFAPATEIAKYYREPGGYESRILAAMLLEAMRIIVGVDREQAGDLIDSTVKMQAAVRAAGF